MSKNGKQQKNFSEVNLKAIQYMKFYKLIYLNYSNQKLNVVLKRLLDMGVFANINQNLGEELVLKLATAFGINIIKTFTFYGNTTSATE